MSETPYYDAVKAYIELIKPSSKIKVGTLTKSSYRRYSGGQYVLSFKPEHGVIYPENKPMDSDILASVVRNHLYELNAYVGAPKIDVEQTLKRVISYAFDRISTEVHCSMNKRTKNKEEAFLHWLRRLYNMHTIAFCGHEASKTVENILRLYVWFMSNEGNPKKYEILVNTLKLMKLKETSR